ncbi:MAG: hypothetical protein COA47_12590 [Robiginitomaculum sp.]|nr:MAG: hypothetical protein COA47_12590 [Robiginitomaculum sp.]
MNQKSSPKKSEHATRPKLASTLILLRENMGDVEFLMGKRAMGHRFMPGKFVFPGGRVDAGDAKAPIATPICPNMVQTMAKYIPETRAFATASAAIRETYEETGLKLAKSVLPSGSPKKTPGSFRAFFDNQLGLDMASLSLLARAITPPYHAKRFDTWFFTARADTLIDDPADLASGELEELQWVTSDQANDLDLPMITRMVLTDLQARTADPDVGTPFYHKYYGKHVRTLL